MIRTVNEVSALILAGGLGTRLRTAVADRPKALAEIEGRPFLSYLLDQLLALGVRHVVLCTGYLGEQIEAAFGTHYGSLVLEYSHEAQPLGTGGAVKYALPKCPSNPMLVMNGDSYCVADLNAFWTWYQQRRIATGALLLTHVENGQRYGQVQMSDRGRIVAFQEKGAVDQPGWINAGIYLLDQALFTAVPDQQAVSLERELFPSWLARGLHGYPSNGDFIDIGLPQSYYAAADFFTG